MWIGTSGWQYRQWRGSFYPHALPQPAWLGFYAERFDTVEVNNAFYRLPEASTFAAWRQRTPPGFVVAVKASRYLTHVKRLREPAEPVERFLSRAGELGPKLGPVLLQLPPTMRADHRLLADALDAFGARVRLTVEFRHESWFTESTCEVLRSRAVALCFADSPRRQTPVWRTAPWGYLRFHEGRASPRPCYGRRALATWAERLAGIYAPDDEVFVYFNNDTNGCALRDARWFAQEVEKVGLRPTRVPGRGEVTLIR